MALGDLNMTYSPAPDYTAPPNCSGQNCPHRIMTEARLGEKTFRRVASIPCIHYRAGGEPAALCARIENGVCPHFVEAVL